MGICDESGALMSGEVAIKAMAVQHDRGNGLGGGFAGYGIYPEFPDHFCFHMMYHDLEGQGGGRGGLRPLLRGRPRRADADARRSRASATRRCCGATSSSPTRTSSRRSEMSRRGLRRPHGHAHQLAASTARSSHPRGKNMGAFKGVGYPEEIGHYFRLEEYEGHTWVGHNRFPTNTPGWWGGAHPFTLLDWSIVHNGEISSYGINSRYLEQFGYKCTLGHRHRGRGVPLRPHAPSPQAADLARVQGAREPAVERDRPHAR